MGDNGELKHDEHDSGGNGKLKVNPVENKELVPIEQKIDTNPKGAGRKSVDENPDIQRKYIEIYLNKVVGGLSEAEIAMNMNIGRSTVGEAIRWCRKINTNWSSAEELTDAINTMNMRMNPWVTKQNKFRRELEKLEALKDRWDAIPKAQRDPEEAPDLAYMDYLLKTMLVIEGYIQQKLDRVFELKSLLAKQLSQIGQVENLQITLINNFTREMKDQDLADEQRRAIYEILRRSAGR